jgi:hypothetical protein
MMFQPAEKWKALWQRGLRHPVLALCALWLALAVFFCASDAISGKGRRDFWDYSLAAARTLYAGGDPYAREQGRGAYKYFPLNATLLWPFTHMPKPLAQGTWTATNVTLLVACLWAHRAVWTRRLRVPWWVWIAALAVALRFFVKNVRLGQWNTSVYCLSFLGLTAIYRGRAWLGGGLVGLAAGLKYMPGFFLLYAAARRHWRACLTMLAGYIFWVLLLPTLVHGPHRHLELLTMFRLHAGKDYREMVEPDYTSSHSLRSTVMRMTTPHVKPRLPDADNYDVTLVRLPVATAHLASEAVAWGILGMAVVVTLGATRRFGAMAAGAPAAAAEGMEALRELLLIGMWYATLLMISPETRTPHMLTLFTPAFGLATALANWRGGARARNAVATLLSAAVVMLLATSEISEKARYHLAATGMGFYAWAQLALWLACVMALFAVAPRPCDMVAAEGRSCARGA